MRTSSRNMVIVGALALIVAAVIWYFQSKDTPSTQAITKSKTNTESSQLEPVKPDKPDKLETNETAVTAVADSSDCQADPNWFPHSSTQRTDDSAFTSSSNCEFHQWAWQNFLWLTQDLNGEPRFMSFASPESLIGKERAGLLPRVAKTDTSESFDEFLQAGTDGIFVAHNGRAVYYSQYLDKTFVNFIINNNLTDPASLRSFIATDPPPTFPIDKFDGAGAMELKVSWMIVEEGDDVSGMFTTETQVAKLVNSNGKIGIDTSQVEDVTVALVGFHIGGIVAGYPEMIWATFENLNNSPVVPTDLPLDQPVSSNDYTFYTANTILADCNVNLASTNQLVLDQSTQKLSPITQVCLQYEFGNADGVNQSNDEHISELNDSVHSSLDENDVWKNYREVGAIWFLHTDSLKPGQSLATDSNPDLTGSVSLSNSTIETFTQVASTENNCFRCHNTLQQLPPSRDLESLPASNLNISHALQNIYFWSQEDSSQPQQNQEGGE